MVALFRYKPKNSETEYGVGWLPLGGYVKIAGMIDESMDKEQLAQPVNLGVSFKTKLAAVTGDDWWGTLQHHPGLLHLLDDCFRWGDSYIPMSHVKQGMEFSETAER